MQICCASFSLVERAVSNFYSISATSLWSALSRAIASLAAMVFSQNEDYASREQYYDENVTAKSDAIAFILYEISISLRPDARLLARNAFAMAG
jgi:hypothetical protein